MPKTRILWIDDDTDLLKPQRDNLEDEGYEIVTEDSIDRAIARLIDNKEGYDGVILDIMMAPGEKLRKRATQGGLKTGLIFLQVLMEDGRLKDLKIFIFTHRYAVEDATDAKRINVSYHLKQDHKGKKIGALVRSEFGPPKQSTSEESD